MKQCKIEFGELRIGNIARKHLEDVVASNWASAGPKVAEFEKKWAELFGYKHSLAVSSGTDADINACAALYDIAGAKRGDEVIVPALAFIAVANSVLAAGLTPVFVDVEKDTLNINPFKIEEKITPRTKAIMAVYTMGKPCNMNAINAIAKERNLVVIGDGCESYGATYHGQYLGSLADMETCSFYAAHLVCCGEGGMVSTNRTDVFESVRSTRSHGRRGGGTWFDHHDIGFNSKMNDLEASLGLEGVANFWQTFAKRKQNLDRLVHGCRDLEEYAWFNKEEDHETVCPHAFSVTLKDPKLDCARMIQYLAERGIKAKRNFGCIPTQHRAYEFMGHSPGEFPEAEYIGDNGFHFGVHQYLANEDIDCAISILHDYFRK